MELKATESGSFNGMVKSPEVLVDRLVSLIEYRGVSDSSHVKRICAYTEVLMAHIYKSLKDKYALTKNDVEVYAKAAVFHDIGKVTITDDVLLKKGRYTHFEHETIKLHSIKGAEIIESFTDFFDPYFYKVCYEIVKYHHERWDGSGYPDGLAGEDIPLAARVVAIADVYDALTSVKEYKPRLPHKTAVEMIANGDCGLFDPEILDCFRKVKGKFERINKEFFGKFE